MARARGANAKVALAYSSAGYGTVPTTGFRPVPVVSLELGEEQGLLESDLLGYGRNPQEAGEDVITNDGQAVVPVDARNFGLWLKLLLGAPTTTQGVAAKGTITFSALPSNNATLTVNGVEITLVTGTPTAGQVKIAATIAETVANLVAFLNASTAAELTPATYSASLSGTVVNVVHDTIGTGGNSFTLARSTSPASNATLSGSTLAGGATSGPYNHVFTAGQQDHPDAAIEIGMPEVPHFGMNFGVMVDRMSIQMQRTGLLNASLQLVAQGETSATSTQAGTLAAELAVLRFAQASGLIEADGVPLGLIESATIEVGNNLDKDESIRPDGRIGGADPGMLMLGLNITARFADRVLFDKAQARTPLRVRLAWEISSTMRLEFVMDRVRLPRVRVPLSGPGGIRATFPCRPVEDTATQNALRAVLVNDVASY